LLRAALVLVAVLGLGLALQVALPGGGPGDGLGNGLGAGVAWAQQAGDNLRGVAPEEPTGGVVPGDSLGGSSDAEIWRAIRGGAQGTVSIPNKAAGTMIQSEGDNWRAIRNGPITVIGGTVILVFIGLIALFFLVRGRIRIDSGMSGHNIQRFNTLERAVHWLTAVCFIILAITGLNMLYGRHVFIPVLGKDVFAWLVMVGKYAHNYLAFPFMLGLVLMFVLWVRHNIPNKYDLKWIALGGGLFTKNVHPPSKKFNAGQKVIFWVVILSGLSLSLSGWSLLFPFTTHFFAETFKIVNIFGAELPAELTAMQEMQLSQMWHGVVALVTIGIMIGHIYIGSIGMEGAFAAMGSGQVDENWAREHHNIWVAEVKGEPHPGSGSHHGPGGSPQPAE
jgi:formate dehydrogenase subunit gamma